MQPIDNQRTTEIIVKTTNTQAPAGVFLREKTLCLFLISVDSFLLFSRCGWQSFPELVDNLPDIVDIIPK